MNIFCETSVFKKLLLLCAAVFMTFTLIFWPRQCMLKIYIIFAKLFNKNVLDYIELYVVQWNSRSLILKVTLIYILYVTESNERPTWQLDLWHWRWLYSPRWSRWSYIGHKPNRKGPFTNYDGKILRNFHSTDHSPPCWKVRHTSCGK